MFNDPSSFPVGRIYMAPGVDINDTPFVFFTAAQGAKIHHVTIHAGATARRVYFYDGTGAAEADGSFLTIRIPANGTVIVPGWDLEAFKRAGVRRQMALTSDTVGTTDISCTVHYTLL